MKTKKKSIRIFWNASIALAVAVAFMLPGSAVLTNDHSAGTISPSSTLAIEWGVTLNFNEEGGTIDYAVFGEAPDANDGEPYDDYDEPKPPQPWPPYIRAWFDDNLPMPYNDIWEDYRSYPDTEKVWDLYAKWDCYDSNLTNITISWDIGGFTGCEYNSVVLWWYDPLDQEWDFATDMFIESNYVYAPRYFGGSWLTDQFQI
ncbi:unnamed protein product, partial [marine sediment metagenome]